MTMTVVGWADVFTRKSHKDAIIGALKYCCEKKGLRVFSYCLMTNHMHMIANCDEPFLLKDTIRDFKKYTAKKIISQIENEPESRREWLLSLFACAASGSSKHKNYQFWQEGNHAIELFSEKFTWEKINYIHENPGKEKFVGRAEDWVYSSARNYAGLDSLIDVEVLTPRLVTLS